MKKLAMFVLCLSSILMANPFCSEESLWDDRDSRCYETVTIGTQRWMAENLTYRNNLRGRYWLLERIPGYHKIAVFYTWKAAMSACPKGWHLPSKHEWKTLFEYVGGKNDYGIAIKKLKSDHGWGNPKDGGNGTDDYFFSAYPVGMIYKDGTYMNNGGSTHFWTTTSGTVAAFPMASSYGGFNYFSDTNGYSVRCVED